MKRFSIILIIGIILIGCNVKHCIKYENREYGNFEYCYDAAKSEIERAPVMTDQSSGTSIIGIGFDLLDQLGDALGGVLASKTLNYESSKSYEPKLKRIKRLLNEYKRRNYNAKK